MKTRLNLLAGAAGLSTGLRTNQRSQLYAGANICESTEDLISCCRGAPGIKPDMAPPSPSSSKAWPISVLLLRLFTIIFLLISVIVLATDSLSYTDMESSSGKTTVRFHDVYAYRYVLSVAVIGCAYTLVWIPFAVYHVANGKPLSVGLPPFNLYMDVVMALVLATGVGAGFGLTLDVKRYFDELQDEVTATFGPVGDDTFSKLDKFLGRAYVSSGFLLAATVAMAALVIGSSVALAKKSRESSS